MIDKVFFHIFSFYSEIRACNFKRLRIIRLLHTQNHVDQSLIGENQLCLVHIS